MRKERITPQPEFNRKVEMIKAITLEQGGHLPMLIVEGSKTPVMTQFNTMPATHKERAQMMFSLGVALAQDGRAGDLREVWFVSEGWMTKADKNGELLLPPSQDPNRIEILSIMATTIDEGNLLNNGVLFEMIRDEEGELAELQLVEQITEQKGHALESPLLMAFFEGFRYGEIQQNSYLN
jgi:hypothetical protein